MDYRFLQSPVVLLGHRSVVSTAISVAVGGVASCLACVELLFFGYLYWSGVSISPFVALSHDPLVNPVPIELLDRNENFSWHEIILFAPILHWFFFFGGCFLGVIPHCLSFSAIWSLLQGRR